MFLDSCIGLFIQGFAEKTARQITGAKPRPAPEGGREADRREAVLTKCFQNRVFAEKMFLSLRLCFLKQVYWM